MLGKELSHVFVQMFVITAGDERDAYEADSAELFEGLLRQLFW